MFCPFIFIFPQQNYNGFYLRKYDCQYRHIGRAGSVKDRTLGQFVEKYGWALYRLVAAALQKIK